MLQIQLRLRGFGTHFSGKLCAVTRIAKTSAIMSSQAPAAEAATATAPVDLEQTAGLVHTADVVDGAAAQPNSGPPREIGGREGLDPTRYGDWELRGRCIDF